MFRIVYLSRAILPLSQINLRRLAKDSSERNALQDVTGLLLYDGQKFIQALEGEQAAVQSTMTRIARDRRHSSIQYYYEGPVESRQFGRWSMQVKRAPAGCCSAEFLESVKHDVSGVKDISLRAAFIGFASLSTRQSSHYAGAVDNR